MRTIIPGSAPDIDVGSGLPPVKPIILPENHEDPKSDAVASEHPHQDNLGEERILPKDERRESTSPSTSDFKIPENDFLPGFLQPSFKIVVADISAPIEAQATFEGRETTNKNLTELGFFQRAGIRLLEAYYQNKDRHQAIQKLASDLQSDTPSFSSADQRALLNRFESNNFRLGWKSGSGSSAHISSLENTQDQKIEIHLSNDNVLRGQFEQYFTKFANNSFQSPEEQISLRQQLVAAVLDGDEGLALGVTASSIKSQLAADNIDKVAAQVAAYMQQNNNAIPKNITIVIGKASSGIRGEEHLNGLEKGIAALQRSVVGSLFINPTSAAVVTASALYIVGTKVIAGTARKIASFGLGLVGGSLVGGVAEALRKGKEVEVDRAHAQRGKAMALSFDQGSRLEEMHGVVQNMVPASSLTSDLQSAHALDDIGAAVGRAEKLLDESIIQKRDFIAYDHPEGVEAGRSALLEALCQAKLRAQAQVEPGADVSKLVGPQRSGDRSAFAKFDGCREKASDLVSADITLGLRSVDQAFKDFKRQKMLKAFGQGTVWGLGTGAALGAVQALWGEFIAPRINGGGSSTLLQGKSGTGTAGHFEPGKVGAPTTVTTTKVVSTSDLIAQKFGGGTDVDRHWMENGTPKPQFDQNELKLDFRSNPDGSITASASRMLPGGSFDDAGVRINPQASAMNDQLRFVISPDQASQRMPIVVPADVSTVGGRQIIEYTIPADSPLRAGFEVKPNGDVVSNLSTVEVAHVSMKNGAEVVGPNGLKISVLATEPGAGLSEFTIEEVVTKPGVVGDPIWVPGSGTDGTNGIDRLSDGSPKKDYDIWPIPIPFSRRHALEQHLNRNNVTPVNEDIPKKEKVVEMPSDQAKPLKAETPAEYLKALPARTEEARSEIEPGGLKEDLEYMSREPFFSLLKNQLQQYVDAKNRGDEVEMDIIADRLMNDRIFVPSELEVNANDAERQDQTRWAVLQYLSDFRDQHDDALDPVQYLADKIGVSYLVNAPSNLHEVVDFDQDSLLKRLDLMRKTLGSEEVSAIANALKDLADLRETTQEKNSALSEILGRLHDLAKQNPLFKAIRNDVSNAIAASLDQYPNPESRLQAYEIIADLFFGDGKSDFVMLSHSPKNSDRKVFDGFVRLENVKSPGDGTISEVALAGAYEKIKNFPPKPLKSDVGQALESLMQSPHVMSLNLSAEERKAYVQAASREVVLAENGIQIPIVKESGSKLDQASLDRIAFYRAVGEALGLEASGVEVQGNSASKVLFRQFYVMSFRERGLATNVSDETFEAPVVEDAPLPGVTFRPAHNSVKAQDLAMIAEVKRTSGYIAELVRVGKTDEEVERIIRDGIKAITESAGKKFSVSVTLVNENQADSISNMRIGFYSDLAHRLGLGSTSDGFAQYYDVDSEKYKNIFQLTIGAKQD